MPAALRNATQDGQFASTRWTVVLDAGASAVSSARALDALSELCRIYWRPLYLFLRREGISAEDAQDLTQGFFAELIRDRSYLRADRERGRFRSFLLGGLKHFVADARDREQAQKRGGGKIREVFDETAIDEAERQVARNERWGAHLVYDHEWAETLLRQAFDRLAQERAFVGKAALFEALKSHLSPSLEEAVPYQELSARLQRPAPTLRKEVERLRARYGEILREEIGGTVSDPAEVDEELRYLCHALTSG
jgi:RNA polymerase sigma-70 factor (ECF subfamily)